MSYTQEELRASGLDDFRVFLVQVWDFLGLPEPTPVQLDMAWWLQNGPSRLVIMAYRGAGKSWITTTFSLWLLFKDPDFKVEVVSASGGLSDDISKFAMQLIKEMPLLQHLKPRKDQRQSSLSFDVGPAGPSKDPSMKSAGINGQITGTRADLIIADDIEIPRNSYTHHLRQKLAQQTKEFSAILKPEDHTRIIYLGTPQVEESLYTNLSQRGFTVMVWPAEVPKNPDHYRGQLAPFVQRMINAGAKPGTPVDPVRFSREVLDERKADYGKSGYALQFMLDTNPSAADKHPLKLSDLIVTDLDSEIAPVKMVWGRDKDLVIQDLPPGGFSGDRYHRPAWKSDEQVPYTGTVMAIDPSGRGKDELAYAIVKVLHSTLYLVDVGGFRDGYSEKTLRALAAAGARHRAHKVIAETNFGGGMFNELFKPYLSKISAGVCGDCLEEDPKARTCQHRVGSFDEDWNGWSVGKKEQRILNTLEPVIQQHRLVVDRRVIEKDLPLIQDDRLRKYSLIFQLTRMENTKGALAHEDRLEAVAMACQYWMERMSQDQDKAVERRRQEKMDEEIRQFMDNVLGRRSTRYNYINL